MNAVSEEIIHAANTLRRGGLVAFPTETVYGLGADASNDEAVQRIFKAKGRPANNPLILHFASADEVLRFCTARGEDPDRLTSRLTKLSVFWPGPLSVIVPRPTGVADSVCAGGDTVAVRVPRHPLARSLLESFGGAVAAPSANLSNYVSPTTAQHVKEELGDKIDLILDGGACEVGLESTVLSIVGSEPVVLRLGAITVEELSKALNEEIATHTKKENASNTLLSPGMLAKHYSPRTPVVLATEFDPANALGKAVGALRFTKEPAPFAAAITLHLSDKGDATEVAARLFDGLRSLDRECVDLIVVDVCEPVGLGAAIMDRLLRASAK